MKNRADTLCLRYLPDSARLKILILIILRQFSAALSIKVKYQFHWIGTSSST